MARDAKGPARRERSGASEFGSLGSASGSKIANRSTMSKGARADWLAEGCATAGHQVRTVPTTIEAIMRSPHFAAGVDDYRRGRPIPATMDARHSKDMWEYERGRQWAALAPFSMSPSDPDARAVFLEGVL
jgi:hypothetical protein